MVCFLECRKNGLWFLTIEIIRGYHLRAPIRTRRRSWVRSCRQVWQNPNWSRGEGHRHQRLSRSSQCFVLWEAYGTSSHFILIFVSTLYLSSTPFNYTMKFLLFRCPMELLNDRQAIRKLLLPLLSLLSLVPRNPIRVCDASRGKNSRILMVCEVLKEK
jgi:hypothetical protein